MKSLLFAFFLFFQVFSYSFASQALYLRGSVYLGKNGTTFIQDGTLTAFVLKPARPEVVHDLAKLSDFDRFSGTGSLDENGTIWLETIDFVFLRRLLGIWKTHSALLNFEDHARVRFRFQETTNEYTYVLAPAAGKAWRIFFTDQKTVVPGAITIENSSAEMEIYDTSTGEVNGRFQLQKVD